MKKSLIASICAITFLLSPLIGRAAALSPSIVEISSVRGGEIDSSFTILNTSASEQVYFLDLLGFSPTDETGTPQFAPITESDQLAHWIKFPSKEIFVPAQSKVVVPFTVSAPDDVPSGGYYVAITVATAPTDVVSTNGAIIEAKTAILVFFTIEGETIESLQLLDFTVEPNKGALPFGTYTFRAQNQGNVHVIPQGEVLLKGFFGNTIAVVNANQAQGRVLPKSTRTFDVVYELGDLSFIERASYQLGHLAIGPMTAELRLTYGEEGVLVSGATFWSTPWELISILFGGFLLLVILFRKRKKRR